MSWIFVRKQTVAWSPNSLSSLYAWYDADDSTTIFDATTGGSLPSSGNDVARWEDKSGGGYHLTQGNAGYRPHYVTNTLNGLPVVQCTSQYLAASTASDWGFLHGKASGDKATVVGIWKAGTSSNPGARYALMGTGNTVSSGVGMMLQYRDDGAANDELHLLGTAGGNYAYATEPAYLSPNAFHMISCWMDPHAANADRVAVGIDGGTMVLPNLANLPWLTLGTPSTADPNGPLEIGSQPSGANRLTGAIAEVCIFDDKLTDTNREKVEGYLAHKWGLTANLPSTHPYKTAAPTV